MKNVLKKHLLPMLGLVNRLSSTKASTHILIFHDIPPIQIKRLEKLIRHLNDRYDIIDPVAFTQQFQNKCFSKKKSLLFSFDDGFYSNYIVAKEILFPLGIRSIFFIPTGFIDCSNREDEINYINNNIYEEESKPDLEIDDMKPMRWEHLSELLDMGNIIGAHTINHTQLSSIKTNSLMIDEITSSGDRIEYMLGSRVDHFAFPFGDINSINANALRIASKRYSYVYSGIRGPNMLDTNNFTIRREPVNVSDDLRYNSLVASGGLSSYYWRDRIRLDEMIRQ